jgi:hypothetical protein
MSEIRVGIHVLLRYAPHGLPGIIVRSVRGKAEVHWPDLKLRTRHHPDALLPAKPQSLGNG